MPSLPQANTASNVFIIRFATSRSASLTITALIFILAALTYAWSTSNITMRLTPKPTGPDVQPSVQVNNACPVAYGQKAQTTTPLTPSNNVLKMEQTVT